MRTNRIIPIRKPTKSCRKKHGCNRELPGSWELMQGKTFEQIKKAA